VGDKVRFSTASALLQSRGDVLLGKNLDVVLSGGVIDVDGFIVGLQGLFYLIQRACAAGEAV